MGRIPLNIAENSWGPEVSGQLTVETALHPAGLVDWNVEGWTLDVTHALTGEDCQGRAESGYRSLARHSSGRVAIGIGRTPIESVEKLKRNIEERYWEGKHSVIVEEWQD